MGSNAEPWLSKGTSERALAQMKFHLRIEWCQASNPNPKALRTHIWRLLGPKTILYKAFGLF